MEEEKKRYVITKPIKGELKYYIKVYQEQVEVDRMVDVTFEVVKYVYKKRVYNGIWAREEGLVVSKEQIGKYIKVIEGKGLEVEIYQKMLITKEKGCIGKSSMVN